MIDVLTVALSPLGEGLLFGKVKVGTVLTHPDLDKSLWPNI
jgi:hypothetical protein